MMEIITNIIDTTLNSFDFSYCIVVNILTYIIIKSLDDANGDKPVSTWTKRVILLIVILLTGTVYYFYGSNTKLLLNSSILAPVFWSWIMKPICSKFNIDYKSINIIE